MSDFSNALATYLPASEGFLPKWLLFISVVSIGNSIQAYTSLTGTRVVYSGSQPDATSPVTPLQARTFGTWTALSSIIRLYAAYNISDPNVYQLCLWTYLIAMGHFVSEWLVFGSTKLGRGLASPLIVSIGTTTWMLSQWSHYVQ